MEKSHTHTWCWKQARPKKCPTLRGHRKAIFCKRKVHGAHCPGHVVSHASCGPSPVESHNPGSLRAVPAETLLCQYPPTHESDFPQVVLKSEFPFSSFPFGKLSWYRKYNTIRSWEGDRFARLTLPLEAADKGPHVRHQLKVMYSTGWHSNYV